MALTPEQLTEIRRMLDAGMAPDDIAHSIGRMADLDTVTIEEIRTAAREMGDGTAVDNP